MPMTAYMKKPSSGPNINSVMLENLEGISSLGTSSAITSFIQQVPNLT